MSCHVLDRNVYHKFNVSTQHNNRYCTEGTRLSHQDRYFTVYQYACILRWLEAFGTKSLDMGNIFLRLCLINT